MIYLSLFIIGFFELVADIIDFKWTQHNKFLKSAILTYLSVWFWYLLLRIILDNLSNLKLVNIYALGCGLGCYVGMKAMRKYGQTEVRKDIRG